MQDTTSLQQDVAPQNLGRAVSVRADGKGSGRVGGESDGVSVGHEDLGARVGKFVRVDGLSGRVLPAVKRRHGPR